jgi:4-oxalmesaconate hydratase
VIIDAHAHLVAPPSFYAHRGNLFVARGQYGKYAAKIADADLEKSAAQNISVMDGVGTDLQVLSPRPFMLVHGETRWEDIVTWTEDNNNLIARTVKMYPKRFRGVGGLPQATGASVESMFDEIKRCMNDLGFLGVLLNPDPSEGAGKTPPLGDSYWYPLYDFLCKHDIPAHIHSCACCGRETYDEHFITEESLAITSIARSDVFTRFPTLKLLVSHGGGSIPYQVGRWRSNRQMFAAAADGKKTETFDQTLKRFWFDTVLHHKKSLELLFEVVGADRCVFGTERPGSGGGIDPVSGRPYDDLKPVIESITEISDDDKNGIFEHNVRGLFARLDV